MSKQKSRIGGVLALLLFLPAWAPTVHALADCSPRGMLWKIRTGQAPPSYLLGTMHSADPRLLDLPAPLVGALRDAKSFSMEVVMDPAAISRLSQRMLLPGNETLQSMLDADSWERVVAAMRRRHMPVASFQRMRPWAVVMILSMPQQFSGLALDFFLHQQARQLGKRVYGLETVDEQVDIFDELGRGEQLKLLRATLAQLPEQAALIAALTKAYLASDLAAMQALADEQMRVGDERFNRRFLTRLVDDRNAKMLRRMQPRLREGGAFIAVGAMHLPGQRGLLCLLRDRGYELQRVY